ncbi:MAG: 1-acyl-sn-glycerol-3-phosphate acyltransferase [Gemmatimonadetes bacterium]|nr:1-acyl-sn-glycerol-3-phosphate acyltransferase [Gemmatimonadota bacterium]
MFATVALPLWLLLLLLLLAGWALLDRLLVPSVRWFLRQQTNRLIDEVNTRLRIEIPAFRLTRREVLVEQLLYDARVQESVAVHAREHGLPREVVMQQVERYAREIVPAFNPYLYFRVGYWLARRVARLLYRVRLGYSDEAGLAGIERGATVVFVMNHRSNVDYILVAYLAAKRAALSYAVGEWARIWPLQTLVRSLGAYFIRRNCGEDLYRRVLERYIYLATTAGVTQALYPEGGLSRDGRLREPKLGLLDYLLRAFDPQGPRDLVFVPVGLNYDRTLEDRTLLREARLGRRQGERLRAVAYTLRFLLRNLWLALRSRWHRFGYACVNFGSPLSMRAYCAARGLDFRRLGKEERFPLVAELGRELMAAVAAVIPVLPVSLVATVFLRSQPLRLSELELKARVQELIAELEAAGRHVYVPRRDRDYALTVGLRLLTLRHLVDEQDGLYVARESELELLEYYANAIGHLLPAPVAAVGAGMGAVLDSRVAAH